MIRRVTDRTFLPQLLKNLNTSRTRINEFQQKISTAQKINKPSDDPYNVENVLHFRSALARNDQYQNTLRESIEFIENTNLALNNITDILASAKEQALIGVDDIGTNQNQVYAQTFDGFLKELIQQAQVQYRNQYVFGGTNFHEKPYELNGANTGVIENANGIEGLVRREVSQHRIEKINISGKTVFDSNVDIFQTIIDIRDAFTIDDRATVQTELDSLTTALDQTLVASTESGKRLNRFEVLASRYQFEATQTLSDLSQVQDVDIAETVTRLQQEETALDAALRVIGRLSNPTLLNYV